MAAIIAVKRSLLLLAEERISARQKERLRVEPRLLSLYGLMIALFFPSFLSLFLSLFRFFLLSFLALSFLPSLLFVPSSFHFFLSNEEETESLSIEFTWERMLELGMNRDRRSFRTAQVSAIQFRFNSGIFGDRQKETDDSYDRYSR